MQITEIETVPLATGQVARPPGWLIVVGANTGGPQALARMLPQLPADFPGTLIIVQQMRPGFTRVLADQLSQVCKLPVSEATDGQAPRQSRILIVPGDTRATIIDSGSTISPDCTIMLEETAESPEMRRSSTDAAMTTSAQVFGERCIGVLMTGVGIDGREGMRAIADAGGITIAQDELSSVVHDLPASAIEAGVVREVLPLWSIADRINDLVTGESNAAAA